MPCKTWQIDCYKFNITFSWYFKNLLETTFILSDVIHWFSTQMTATAKAGPG